MATSASDAGSGTRLPGSSGVALPKVMSSNTIWLATPAKDTDMAVPAKFTPAAVKGQKPAL